MITYNEFLLEVVKNEKYASYIFDNIVQEISKIIPIEKVSEIPRINPVDKISLTIDKLKEYWVLNLYYNGNIEITILNRIINILDKYRIKLLNSNILLSYTHNIKNKKFYNKYADSNQISVYYKDIYVKRVSPKKYYYHFTDNKNLPSILKNGLIPKSWFNSQWGNLVNKAYPDAIFVSDAKNLFFGDTLLRIDTTNISNKWFDDLNMEEDRYMTFEPIPPEAIDVVSPMELTPIYSKEDKDFEIGHLKENKFSEREVVSFDFDGVLHLSMISGTIEPLDDTNYDTWIPSENIHQVLLNEHKKGNKIIIISSRAKFFYDFEEDKVYNTKDSIKKFLKMYNLPVEDIILTNNYPKKIFLIHNNVIRHYDDNVNLKYDLWNTDIEFVYVYDDEIINRYKK